MPSTNAYDGKDEKSSLLTTSSGTTAGNKVEEGMTARVLLLLKSKNTVIAMLCAAVGLLIFGAAILKNTGSPLRTTGLPILEESEPYCEVASASDTFKGYEDRDEIDRSKPFQLCFRAYDVFFGTFHTVWKPLKHEQNCWTKSYYDNEAGKFESCLPQGYWSAVEKREAGKCGGPCTKFEPISPKPCCSVASAWGSFGGDNEQVFNGLGFKTNRGKPFHTCFQAHDPTSLHPVDPPQYCWTESYYGAFKDTVGVERMYYEICRPQGPDWGTVRKDNVPADGCGDSCNKLSNDNQPVC